MAKIQQIKENIVISERELSLYEQDLFKLDKCDILQVEDIWG
jgi:hypothetical protein